MGKRLRKEGDLGYGWEHITPERSPDPGGAKEFQGTNIESKKPLRFSDIPARKDQVLQTTTREAENEMRGNDLEKKTTKQGKGHRISTPIRMKVKRYEELSKDIEVHKSLRKVRKLKDKPREGGEGVQISIRKFLRKIQEVEKVDIEVNRQSLEPKVKALSPEITIKPSTLISNGARTKPGLAAKTPRPVQGPSTREGGKKAGGMKKERKKTFGTLEKWLLPLGRNTGPSGTAGHGQGDQG